MPYIDQKAAVDAVKEVIGDLDHQCKHMMDFYSALWNVPVADVERVVRCIQCRHCVGNALHPGELFCRMTRSTVPHDGFCYRGELQINGVREG